jgi:hypothetical protein
MQAPQPKSKRVAFLAVAPFEAATVLAWAAVLRR